MRIQSSFNNVSNLLNASKVSGDRPADVAINQKFEAQQRGLDQGVENAQDGINLANTAEGSLNTATDSLQQIRELAVQASNGVLADEDKAAIQSQIEGLKADIQGTLRNTEFNTIKVNDGFEGNIQTGANAGQGRQMNIENTTLDTLGIADFDVTGSFDISTIDNAIEQVSGARAEIGAQTNGLESTIRSNQVARENTLSSQSQLNEDFEEAISNFKKEQVQDQIQTQVQTIQQQQLKAQQKSSLDILG